MRSGIVAPSIPNADVKDGMAVQVQVTASGNAVATRSVQVLFTLETSPTYSPSGTSIFFEPLFTGPGTHVVFTPANPIAGADFATQTVGTKSGWRVLGIQGTLTTAIAIANRVIRVFYQDSAGNSYVQVCLASLVASLTTFLSLSPGIADKYSATLRVNQTPTPYTNLLASEAVAFQTDNLQAADQFSNLVLEVEEWAIP
jgi:hypothetical protein